MSNGWNYNQQLCMMIPVWFDGPQFPPSIRKKIIQRRRYQSMVANLENTEEILLSAPKKRGKLKQLN